MTTVTFEYGRPLNNIFDGLRDVVANGVSETAKTIESICNKMLEEDETTISKRDKISLPTQIIEDLIDLLNDENSPSLQSFEEALSLIAKLPNNLPLPTPMTEPGGAIAFEWYKDPSNVFVISINGTSRMEYAAIFGSKGELHGKMSYTQNIPEPIRLQLDYFYR
jgi:hypothetical protein